MENTEIKDLAAYLPQRLAELLSDAPEGTNEVRLRRGSAFSVTAGSVNKILGSCTPAELEYTVMKLCGGTLHAHEAEIGEGYIPFGNGGRAGVCSAGERIGRAADVTSVNIRLPRAVFGISEPITEYIVRQGYGCGVLLYSPPAAGKTTVLRDIARTLSRPPHSKRVCLIDSRAELFTRELEGGLIDVIGKADKGGAITEAIRVMSPQYLICDEIGTMEEAEAIVGAQNTGVPLIASAHSGSYEELMRRPAIRLLERRRIFGVYVGLSRRGGRVSFEFHGENGSCVEGGESA